MTTNSHSPEVNRFLFQEAPGDIRRCYAAAIGEATPSSRHANLCHLAEASLASLASMALSLYRGRRWQDPDSTLEAMLGRTRRFSMGNFLELLRLIQALPSPSEVRSALDGGGAKLPACSNFAATVAGIQKAVDTGSNNLRRVVEERRAMNSKSISWMAFWMSVVEYRNRALGHSLSYDWPVNHPDYYDLTVGPLEAALVEALTTPALVRLFDEYSVASLLGIRYEAGRFLHEFSGERAGLPIRIHIGAGDSVTDRWADPAWHAVAGQPFVLHREGGGYEVSAPFFNLMKEGAPPLPGESSPQAGRCEAAREGNAPSTEKEVAKPPRERKKVALFGREVEFRNIEAVLDRVAGEACGEDPSHLPGGHLILLSGESGVGKSAMAQETCRLASERGFDLVEVACEPFHEGMSLFPMREIVRQLLQRSTVVEEISDFFGRDSSEVATARSSEQGDADPAQRREALVATFANIVYGRFSAVSRHRGPRRPLLIFIDDLERIDVGTCDALVCILARLREGPVVILGAYRSDLVRDADGRKHTLLHFLKRARSSDERLLSINLGALSPGSIKEVTAAILGGGCRLPSRFYARLYRETEGNALFIREILKTLTTESSGHRACLTQVDGVWQMSGEGDDWEIPSSIEDVIAARLELLDADQRRELEKAAVIGRRFAFSVVCQLSAASEEEVLGYVESFLNFDIIHELRGGDDTYEFSHGKLRDVLLQSMTGLRRRKVHSQVADILMKLQPRIGENWDAMIGEHLYQAQRFGEACPLLLRAARLSLRVFAVSEAASQFHKAVIAGEKGGFPEGEGRFRIRMQEAESLKLANEHEAAKAIFEEVAGASDEPGMQGWAHNHLGDIHLLGGKVQEALLAYERAEQFARQVDDETLLAETFADLTELYDRQAERLAGQDAEQSRRFRVLHSRYLDQEVDMAERCGESALRARAFRNVAKRHRTSGRLDEAIACYQRAVDLSEGGVVTHQTLIPFAKALRLVGRRDEATGHVQRVLDWGVQAGIRRTEAIARQYKGLLLWELGRSGGPASGESARALDQALAEFEQALKLHEEVGFEQGVRETEMLLAEWHLDRGDRAEALAHFEKSIGTGFEPRVLLRAAAEQLRANGETARAEAVETASSKLLGVEV